MTKQIIVEMSDSRYKEFAREVGEMLELAKFIEADVKIRDA